MHPVFVGEVEGVDLRQPLRVLHRDELISRHAHDNGRHQRFRIRRAGSPTNGRELTNQATRSPRLHLTKHHWESTIMQARPGAQAETPIIMRGARLKFGGEVPSSSQAFPIRIPRTHAATAEAVGIVDDYGPKHHDLLGLRCKIRSDEVTCWLRRDGETFRMVRVDPPYPLFCRC